MTHVDLRLLDELCIQMRQHADTIDKLLRRKKCQTVDTAFSMAKIVFETREQLAELMSVKNEARLDDDRLAMIAGLVGRYEALEGALKEIRNDLMHDIFLRNQAQEPLQKPARDRNNNRD